YCDQGWDGLLLPSIYKVGLRNETQHFRRFVGLPCGNAKGERKALKYLFCFQICNSILSLSIY
ncbi:hypothetical protein, partial [Anabaena sp. CCY 9910]|uniref:hypothetical protein n=1 Tax=Anabaena sp. CCY 9910 TaxID=3103870 RepID=UPI0039E0EC3A